MWIYREISDFVKSVADSRPVLLLTGARQTGKTSLCHKCFPEYSYVSLDLPRIAEEAEDSGEQFLKNHAAPVIIDEAQYAPALFRYLKEDIDRNRNQTGRYVLTGSQKFSLMSEISDSLAGRISICELYSLSLSELERWSKVKAEGTQLLQWMYTGGYPEIHAGNIDPNRFYSDYVATYLERDVRHALNVRNLRDFNRFMRLAAVRTGQLFSISSFASDIGVSPNTIKSWISVLEASQIIYLLEPFYQNLGKRIIKSPKLYFMDTGLACFLAGIRSEKDLKESALLGAIFETLALGQIIRRFTSQGKKPQIYFYRDHYGLEVDFVLPVGEKLKLYECKWSEHPPKSVKAFHVIESRIGSKNVISKSIITPVRGQRKNSENVTIEDCVQLDSIFR